VRGEESRKASLPLVLKPKVLKLIPCEAAALPSQRVGRAGRSNSKTKRGKGNIKEKL